MSESKRLHRSREEIAAILDQYERNGLTQAAFAKQNGLSISTLRSWLYRRRQERSSFVAVDLEQAPDTGSPCIEIDLGDKRRVFVPADFDAESLAALLPIVVATC